MTRKCSTQDAKKAKTYNDKLTIDVGLLGICSVNFTLEQLESEYRSSTTKLGGTARLGVVFDRVFERSASRVDA